MIEIVFTRPLTTYNNSEPIISALFSRAKPLRSPRLVQLNSFKFDQKPCNPLRFSRPFCLLHLLGFLQSSNPFSHFFPSDSQSCVVGFLIKQLFFSGLLDMKSALRASLVIYIIREFTQTRRRRQRERHLKM